MVFTGKMALGNRTEMQDTARNLGAIVQTAVSGKTDYLVCGENVGVSKLRKAEKLGVNIIKEIDYLNMIAT